MYSLPKPGYDLATMRAVAAAYRRESQAGRLDGPAREAAIAAYLLEWLPPSAGHGNAGLAEYAGQAIGEALAAVSWGTTDA